MKILTRSEITSVSGGVNITGLRPSTNIYDGRGKNMGGWISAGFTCWKPGTPTSIMYVGGYPRFRF